MMKSDIVGLFSTPVYHGVVERFDEVQNELNDCITDINFGMRDGWSSTHYLSDPHFQSNLIIESNLNIFKSEIEKHLKEYCIKTGVPAGSNGSWNDNYSIISSWFALFKKGNYAHIHNHGESDIAGVYYFKKSGDDGNLFFCTPNKAIDSSVLLKTGRMVVNPTEGELILFPGWLDHGVQTNDTDDERVSVSFNIRFEGR